MHKREITTSEQYEKPRQVGTDKLSSTPCPVLDPTGLKLSNHIEDKRL